MASNSWVIKTLLKVTSDYLNQKNIDSPRLTAEILLAHLLGVDRVYLYLNFDRPLQESEIHGYRKLIRRRLEHEPVQYITGVQEFRSLEFDVGPAVLIPRPESELLIEEGLKRINTGSDRRERRPECLDLGTGCGALAITLAVEVPEARIWAADVSAAALEVARINAEKHGVADRIEFFCGHLWEPVKAAGLKFDLIVSNPPYVAVEEYDQLPPEVRDWEPRKALDGKKAGMFYISEIIRRGPEFLNPHGWLLLEMAPGQTKAALGLIEETGGYREKTRIKDYSRRYRVVIAQRA
jgi:release factor glutamine methyltransferase